MAGISHTKAQHTFWGVVTDATSGEPVEMATVQLLKGSAETYVNYTLTDAKGFFKLTAKQPDSIQVAVSLLGYKTSKQAVRPGEGLQIRMEPQAFSLREVEIRPGRVWGTRDTINYDVSQFLTSSDESIKDVLKKLPGVNVDDLGKISYNGKEINKLYVEGMDLTDSRYNQMTNNLQAKSVETVQLLENHQPIRILQDKIKTEDVALNLKLKPEFRDKWMVTIRGGLGMSPLLWDATGNALQLGRNSQTAYTYKGNNAGIDVTDELMMLFNRNFGSVNEPVIPSFLSQPSIMAPLKKERLLFNNVHTLSGNRLYRLNETTQLRINAVYTHDNRRQERGSETYYFQPHDTLHILEQNKSRIRSDEAELSFNIEKNSASHYLVNKLKTSGSWEKSLARFTGNKSIDQQIKTTNLGVRNDFRNIWNKEDYTLGARSVLRYNHNPAHLAVNEVKEQLDLDHFYTDNSFSLQKKNGSFSHNYTAGFTGQVSNIKNGFSLYAIPSWQLSRNKWLANLNLPFIWTSFGGSCLSRLAVNPFLSLTYKLNYAWRFSVSANYNESYGNILHLYTSPYQTDYRNAILNNGNLPIRKNQYYSVYGEFKNTIQEFFSTLAISHSRGNYDQLYEQVFEGEKMTLVSHQMDNHSYGWTLNGTISKGFYDWGLKTSLNYRLGRNKAEQLTEGIRMPYQYDYMQYEPGINWSPNRRFQADYLATIRYGVSKIGEDTRLTPLWNVVQKLQLSYELSPWTIKLSTDHYHNDVSSSKSIDKFFIDLSLRWKYGSWQLEAYSNNLLNNKQYRYTEYTSNQSYTSWIDIRGREFILAAKYTF